MTKTYFEKISLIEWIYLEDENLLLQRDWSKYFEFEILFLWKDVLKQWMKEFFIENEKTKLDNDDIKELKKVYNSNFINWLNDLLKNHQDIYEIVNKQNFFDVLNPNINILNERKYWFNENKSSNYLIYKNDFNKLLTSYFLAFKYSIDKNIVFTINVNELEFCIFRKFNFKEFFIQNEVLFNPDNDFFHAWINPKIKKILWKLKETDENWKKIELKTIENMIKTWKIKEEHIFRVDINFDNKLLDLKDIKIEWNKEYNFLFYERNDYLVFDMKE